MNNADLNSKNNVNSVNIFNKCILLIDTPRKKYLDEQNICECLWDEQYFLRIMPGI